jgi:hypothetical protein
MPMERDPLRDWHRLFGLLLTDFFSGSPFTVEVERDLSQQQQFFDVAIVRRGHGRFTGRLPDGMEDLGEHNLVTFKSHREALDSWTMRELIGHLVAYRKLVSPKPSQLLPEELFRLYAVCARFPHNLAGQVPWRERQAGVYDCQWGVDAVRVIVAGLLPLEPHNAPLHLFSASPDLVAYGRRTYRRQSPNTSMVLGLLFDAHQAEGLAMYTMEDLRRDFLLRQFAKMKPKDRQTFLQSLLQEERREVLGALTPEDQEQLLQSLPAEKRMAGLSAEQIREYLDRLTAGSRPSPRKPRRKK